MRFALQTARDWRSVPVLRDALLEHPETAPDLERAIGFAVSLAKSEHQHYVVALFPRLLSPTWRSRKGFGQPPFAVYAFDRRHPELRDLIEALARQRGEPVVPVYGARRK